MKRAIVANASLGNNGVKAEEEDRVFLGTMKREILPKDFFAPFRSKLGIQNLIGII